MADKKVQGEFSLVKEFRKLYYMLQMLEIYICLSKNCEIKIVITYQEKKGLCKFGTYAFSTFQWKICMAQKRSVLLHYWLSRGISPSLA